MRQLLERYAVVQAQPGFFVEYSAQLVWDFEFAQATHFGGGGVKCGPGSRRGSLVKYFALAQFLSYLSISHSSIHRSAGSSNLSLCPACITCSSVTCMISFCKPKLRWVFDIPFGAEEAKTSTCPNNTRYSRLQSFSLFTLFHGKLKAHNLTETGGQHQ